MKTKLTSVCLLAALSTASVSKAEVITFARAQELIKTYCIECHNPAEKKGGLDLAILETEADFLEDSHLLEDLEWVVAEKEMPVPSAPKQPTSEEREELVLWLQQELMKIQNAMPNDPGRVIMPRISSKEFDYFIEDLTGFDYNLSQYLTADTSGGEGFYNVGASQNLSIGQFESFMSVGKMLVGHSRWVPGNGIWWMNAPDDPLEKDSDLPGYLRDKWYQWHQSAIESIVSQHLRDIRSETPFRGLGAYLEAAWQYRHQRQIGMSGSTVAEIAASYNPPLFVSSLEKLVAVLEGDAPEAAKRVLVENKIMARLLKGWQDLPAPRGSDPHGVRGELKNLLAEYRGSAEFNDWGSDWNESGIEIEPADRPSMQQRRGFFHQGRGTFAIDLTKLGPDGLYLAASGRNFPGFDDPDVVWTDGKVKMEDGRELPWEEVFTDIVDEDRQRVRFDGNRIHAETPGYLQLKVPQGARSLDVVATYAPDQKGMGPLRAKPASKAPEDYTSAFAERKVIGQKLDEPESIREALRDIHETLYFDSHHRNLFNFDNNDVFVDATDEVLDYVGLDERPSPEDRDQRWTSLWSITPDEVRLLAPDRMRNRGQAIWTNLAQAASANRDPNLDQRELAREELRQFAQAAWRGPLAETEIEALMFIFENEINQGQSTESAVETAMRAVMIAPRFLYRFTESEGSADPYLLEGREIAVRLASVLWSGLPDNELYILGERGMLTDPKVIREQIDRMLEDPRADRFIEEFFGRWLHFAEFESFSGPDQEKFTEWTPQLAQDMHQEAHLFIKHLLKEDRPLTDLFFADYTFLNERLAKHYGISGVDGSRMRLVELEDSRRGGILGMGAFLTITSTPLRTSPVHRGLWIYEDILDMPVPEPPPVPLLSDDGVDAEGRGLVEQLRQHRDNPACYSCHDRFDPMGVALENFDPIGRHRTRIEGKAAVISKGEFRSGESIDGISGLKQFLKSREDGLLEAYATKLLGYSIGRSVLPTDKPTLEAMITEMREANLSPRAAIHTALTSPQFLYRRDAELASK